jgi:hypothetical protein
MEKKYGDDDRQVMLTWSVSAYDNEDGLFNKYFKKRKNKKISPKPSQILDIDIEHRKNFVLKDGKCFCIDGPHYWENLFELKVCNLRPVFLDPELVADRHVWHGKHGNCRTNGEIIYNKNLDYLFGIVLLV